GYKISHINKMNEEEISQKLLSLDHTGARQEMIVNNLIKFMIDLDMVSLERSIDKFIKERGIEKAITQIIFKFLEKIGILWLTNHINPAQEHLVSNMIRQKLIVGIDTVSSPIILNRSVLLFLPEGEYHELGLLFMHFILKSRGVKVIYLGSSIPLQDVSYLVELKRPDYLYCHLTTVGQNFNFDKFLYNLCKKVAGTPIIVSGQLTNTYTKKIHPPVYFKRTLDEVMEFVGSL
ncbi:MAG: B12-binding domain-containing protein, partial [Ferruginibacter sp.]